VCEAALEAADEAGGAEASLSPLRLNTLQQLGARLNALTAGSSGTASHALMTQVPEEQLNRLLEVLDACIAPGVAADLGPQLAAGGRSNAPGGDVETRAMTALEAAACMLCILCARGMPPKWASQERVASLLDVLKMQLTRSVLTWYDPHRRRAATAGSAGGAAEPTVTPPARKKRKTGKGGAVPLVDLDDAVDGEQTPGGSAHEEDAPQPSDDAEMEEEGFQSDGQKGTKTTAKKGAHAAAPAPSIAVGAVPACVRRVLDRLCGGIGGGVLAQAAALAACTRLHDAAVSCVKDCALAAMEPPLGGSGPVSVLNALMLLHQRGVVALGRIFGAYPQHRGLILDDLVSAAMRMPPASRKPPRCIPLMVGASAVGGDATAAPGPQSGCITPVVAALLMCLQCTCVLYPGGDDVREQGGAEAVKAAHSWGTSFWASLLSRGGASAKAAEVDHKGVVTALIADLCACLTSPEWPACGLALFALAKQLTSQGSSVATGLHAPEAAQRSMCITWLGQLVARLRAALAQHRSGSSAACSDTWSAHALASLSAGGHNHGNTAAAAAAGSSLSGERDAVAAMVHAAWGHLHHLRKVSASGALAGDMEPPSDIDLAPVSLVNALQSGGEGCDDHLALVQHCTLLCLCAPGPEEAVSTSAHRFCCAQWATDARRGGGAATSASAADVDARLRPQWLPLNGAPSAVPPPPRGLHAAKQLLPRTVAALTSCLLATRPLARHGDGLLASLASCLSDSSPVVRAAALKAVSAVCDADPHALALPSLRDSVVLMLEDPSISVRAEAVELVGSATARVMQPQTTDDEEAADAYGGGAAAGTNSLPVVAASPMLLDQYFDALAKRVFDTGVSVRKRAMHILRDAVACPGFSRGAEALARLVGRIQDEEESVQLLTIKLFTSAWCGDATGAGKRRQNNAEVAQQMADVAEVLYTSRGDGSLLQLTTPLPLTPASPLCALISRMLQHPAAGTASEVAHAAHVRASCCALAEALREKVLEAEEEHAAQLAAAHAHDDAPDTTTVGSGSRFGAIAASEGAVSGAPRQNAQAQVQAALASAASRALPVCLALHALCVADPSLCCPPDDRSRLMATLAPYVVPPPQLGSAIAGAVAAGALTCLLASAEGVVSWHADSGLHIPRELAERLANALVVLTNRATQQSLFTASVRCLCALAHTEGLATAALARDGGAARAAATLRVVHMARRMQTILASNWTAMKDNAAAGSNTPNGRQVTKCFAVIRLLACHGAPFLDAAACAEEEEAAAAAQEQGGDEAPAVPVSSPLRAAALLKLFAKYMRSQDGILQTAALRACGGVLVSHPELLLPEAAQTAAGPVLGGGQSSSSGRMALVHTVALQAKSSDLVKAAALQNLADVFAHQETELLKQQSVRVAQQHAGTAAGTTPAHGAHKQQRRGSKAAAALADGDANGAAAHAPLSATAGGGDSSICGALAQHFWEHVLGRVNDPCLDVRRKALACVEVLLRGGLVMPMHAVPKLMAAACDEDSSVHKTSMRMLTSLVELDAMFLVTRCGEGILAAWAFKHALAQRAAVTAAPRASTSDDDTLWRAVDALGDLYWRFRGVKNLRTCLVTALLRMLEDGGGNAATTSAGDGVSCDGNALLSRQRFAASVLVGLPFCGIEEPTSIVASLNRVISTAGASLELHLKADLAHARGGAQQAAPMAAPLGKDALQHGSQALAISLCLLAKARLRSDFGLTDAAMLKFNAGDGPAPVVGVDKLTAPAQRTGLGQDHIASGAAPPVLDTSCVPQIVPSTWDALAAAAGLLKRLMRELDSDDFDGALLAPAMGARKAAKRAHVTTGDTPAAHLTPGNGDAHAMQEVELAVAAASTGAAGRGRGKSNGSTRKESTSAGRGRGRGRGGSAGRTQKKASNKRTRAEWSASDGEAEEEPDEADGDSDDGDEDDTAEVMPTPKKRLRLG